MEKLFLWEEGETEMHFLKQRLRPLVKGGNAVIVFSSLTFEQEIVFIVSVPHSGRGRCKRCSPEEGG